MKKVSLVGVFIFCVWASLFAARKPVMVISTFDAKDFSADDVEFVMNLFTSSFANLGLANIVDRSSFDKIKRELSFQESDWSDNNKVAELGKALNANQVVVGQIIKRRSKVVLTVKIVDVNTTTIVASNIGTVRDIDDFLDSMPAFCAELMKNAKGLMVQQDARNVLETGSVDITSEEEGASESSGEYRIGSVGPGGGLVFYISNEGFEVYDGMGGKTICHYLEVAQVSKGLSCWSPGNMMVDTETGLGYGKSNTYKILNTFRNSDDMSAYNCAAYRANKYHNAQTKQGEWWLPSKDELNLLQKALLKNDRLATLLNDAFGFGGFWGTLGFYWSSSKNLTGEYIWTVAIGSDRNSRRVYPRYWEQWVLFVRAF